MLYPDNFFYFITLFSLALSGGVYLLMTNKRNYLLLLNAFVFFLCAIRICTEYYLHQIEDFENVRKLMIFHRGVMTLFGTSLWTLIWFYIRPLRSEKWERLGNRIYFWGVLLLPYPFIFYVNSSDLIYEISPEKIAGFWKFTMHESMITIGLQIYILLGVVGINVVAMLVEITRNKKDRYKKIIALLCFLLLPYLVNYLLLPAQDDKWNIPNTGLTILIYAFSATWFVSNYRFLYNPFNKTISDLLDSISDLAFFTDAQFTIVDKNKIAIQEFGVLNVEKNMLTILAQYSQFTVAQIDELVHNLAVEKNATKELKLVIDDKEKIYQLKIAKFERGNLHLGYTFILTNLTEILEREQALKTANVIKDNLFAIISHDLRKPALAFRGISKKVNFLIQQKRFADLNKYGHSLESAAFSLNNLLDNLLNWALQQRDVLPYSPKNIKVAEVTQEILALFNQMAVDKNIAIHTTISEEATAFVDENVYATIIRNLVDNAIKYTPTGGRIDLAAEQLAETIIISVKDSGIGIAAEKMETLFELKANKSKRGTVGEKGTGLGLSLVRDLVKLNKGTIKVKKNWRQGVIFEVALPVG